MKLVLFDGGRPGVLKGDTVIDITPVVGSVPRRDAQELMAGIIADFPALRPAIERLVAQEPGVPLSSVGLMAPLPRPSKILCMIGNYKEGTDRETQPIDIFLKSPDSVIGPEGTVILPDAPANIFHHEAELGVVIGRYAKHVSAADAMNYVFGYTAFIDVSARGLGRGTSFIGKSFDTFCPIGPCIVTADELTDPHKLAIKLWDDGQLRHDYNTDDMEHPIPTIIAWASNVMGLNPGDILACGTNHQGLGPIQDGERVEIEIEGVGRFGVNVVDPLKRSWPKMVDVEAARRVRESRPV